MLRFSDDFLYSKDHLWVLVEEEGSVQIGATEVLISIAGEPDEVEFMAVEGQKVGPGLTLARLLTEDDEWEVPAPFAGTVVNFNLEAADHPESVADDPYDEGWLVRMVPDDPKGLNRLLESSDYEDFVVDQLAELEEDLLDEEDEFEDDGELDGGGFLVGDEEEEEGEEEDDF